MSADKESYREYGNSELKVSTKTTARLDTLSGKTMFNTRKEFETASSL
jgi:hypothetical protein